MEEILEVAKNVTVFVLVFSILSNLFSKSKYYRYFRFVEGILLIIFVMGPLFSWFTSDTFLDECLGKNMSCLESSFEEEQLRTIGEQRDQMLREGWEKEEGENNYEEG